MHSANQNRSLTARRLAAALAVTSAAGVMAVALAVPAYAQEANASLRGRISADSQVSQVSAVEVATGVRRTVTVASDGSYNFASLRPSTYRLELQTADGVKSTEEFTLLVAQDAVIDFDLSAAGAGSRTVAGVTNEANEIVVSGARFRSMEGGEVGLNITRREVETLPQINRNFLAFADLAPGVQFVTNGAGQSRLQGGAQDSRTTNVFIDGVGQKDYVLKNGITGQDSTAGNPFPQSAIGEYRVLTSNYKAEFDQVSSVAITAVTRSGTNEFHGEAFFEYTDEGFRSRTPSERFLGRPGRVTGDFTGPKTPQQDIQYGVSLAGPIIRDKLFFFGTYEGKRIDQPLDINPGSGNNVGNIPSAFANEFGSFSKRFNEDLYFGKLDFAPNDADLIQASLKYRRETGDGINSGSSLRSTTVDQNVKEWRGLLRWEHTADNWINDLKLTFEDASWFPTPRTFENGFRFQDANGVQLFQTGGASNYQDKGQKGYGIQNDFTWIGLPGHTIKAGVKAKWVKLNSLQLNLFNPLYTFNTQYNPAAMNNTGTFNSAVPYQVQFGFDAGLGANPIVTSDNFQLGLFIQDDWEVNDRLTLNLGVRWDYDRTPSYVNFVTSPASLAAVSPTNYPNLVNADYDINDFISTGTERKTFTGAFQPRIGFSYLLDPETDFTLFGGFGRSYDRNQFDFLQQEVSRGGFTTRTFRFRVPGDARNNCNPSPTCVAWDPVYLTPAGLAQLVNSVGPTAGEELRFIDNDLKVPYSDQFSIGVRRNFGLLNAEVGFTHIESRDGFAYLLGNRRPDGSFFAPTGNQNSPFGFAPPGRGSIIIGTNGLETNADSAYLKLVKRYTASSPWNITATYTYTEAEENRNFGETFALDFPSTEDYPFLFSRGVSKHRFVTAGSADLPLDFVISAKMTLASPPFVSGFANDPTGKRIIIGTFGNNTNPAPFLIFDKWALRQFDMALKKNFALPFLTNASKLWVRADLFNVFNWRNYTSYNGNPNDNNPTDGNGGFGDVSNFSIGGNPPRTLKLSVGFEF
ncbi:TonB-dependent receptor [Tsuneonella sp. SYSU-LHT278]|uniref:TonB-dependent receptor n=1 Tax=Tsuneonella sediminis TaxID=3416089 RepID=UPI003F7A73DF